MKSIVMKYLPWILLVVAGVVFFKVANCQSEENKALQTYQRQLQGQLDDSERYLQEANNKLGVAQSELLTQQELNDRLKKEKEEVDKDFEAFKKHYNLIIQEKDLTIARLRQQIEGGSSDTNTDQCEGISENCIISYGWSDSLSRFTLQDPNIFEQDNELFTANQTFKILGQVYKQKDGSLKTKRIVLREMYKDGDKYKEVPNGKAEILESHFEYSNEPFPTNTKWYDIFELRPIIVASLNGIPDPGRTNLGLGVGFLNWHGMGLNTQVSLDFTNAKKIEHRLGISYSPKIKDKQLNVAFGLSAGSPYYKFLKQYSISGDLIFYLW